jgi:hypothetical protein
MEKRHKEAIALLVFPQKLEEMKLGQALKMNVGSVALKIGESHADVQVFINIVIAKMVMKETGLSIKIPEMSHERQGEIAYKLLSSYVCGNGIRLSENIRREVGSWSAGAGMSTDEGMEFLAEIIKDTFFSKSAD